MYTKYNWQDLCENALQLEAISTKSSQLLERLIQVSNDPDIKQMKEIGIAFDKEIEALQRNVESMHALSSVLNNASEIYQDSENQVKKQTEEISVIGLGEALASVDSVYSEVSEYSVDVDSMGNSILVNSSWLKGYAVKDGNDK